jgi:replicative DNA helicase
MIASSEIQVEAFDESQEASAVMGKAVGMLEVLATQFSVTKEVALGDEVANILEESEDIALGEATPGDSTGFGGLDDAFGGLRGGDLVIVAGRPGMGKTALAGDIIQAFLDRGEPAGFISLEMSRKELIGRQIAKKSEIDSLGLSTGSLTESDWIRSTKGAAVLMRQPLFIEDDPTINVSAAKGVIRKWVRLHGIKVVVVDYIQLMGGTGSEGNREQEIAGISRGLKVAAKELNIPVIALSQLNRGLELRGGRKRPTMADLRESGAIEQDADIVLMCYRPDYYGFTEWEDGEACQGQAEVIIAKSRRGGTKDVRLEWVDYCAKFKDRN